MEKAVCLRGEEFFFSPTQNIFMCHLKPVLCPEGRGEARRHIKTPPRFASGQAVKLSPDQKSHCDLQDLCRCSLWIIILQIRPASSDPNSKIPSFPEFPLPLPIWNTFISMRRVDEITGRFCFCPTLTPPCHREPRRS